jgi:hypothetical protein
MMNDDTGTYSLFSHAPAVRTKEGRAAFGATLKPGAVALRSDNDTADSALNLTPLKLPPGWQVRNLSDAIDQTDVTPPWVVKELVLAESATQVSAHPHSMKSLAWLAATLEAAAKHTVWGHFDASGVNRSLFIETEDSRWLLEDRLRGLAKGFGLKGAEDVPGFNYLRTGPFDLVRTEVTLTQILEHYKPDFVVLSTLQALLVGRDWNDQDAMQAVNSLIVRLSSQYCPIVEITHSPWDKREKRAAGTITQAANFATALHFEKRSDKDGTFVRVTVDSKLGAEETDFSLRLGTEGKEVRCVMYDGPGWLKGSKKEAIIRTIEEEPECSSRDIAERVGATPRHVQKVKKELQNRR